MGDAKACTNCGETKPLDEFVRDSRTGDGRTSRCRKCTRAKANARNAANPGQRADYFAAYHRKEADRIHERQAAYRAENPHKGWAHRARHRAAKYGFSITVEDFTKADVISAYGDSCAYCSEGAFEHLDHYVPTSRGGHHTLANVRPSCRTCNRAKSDRTPAEMAVRADGERPLMTPATPFETDADQSAHALAQSAWDALRILGFDTDGDRTPAAWTTEGYAQLGRVLIETATDVRACYDEALDAMPDEPRRVETDATRDHDDASMAEEARRIENAANDGTVVTWARSLNTSGLIHLPRTTATEGM